MEITDRLEAILRVLKNYPEYDELEFDVEPKHYYRPFRYEIRIVGGWSSVEEKLTRHDRQALNVLEVDRFGVIMNWRKNESD